MTDSGTSSTPRSAPPPVPPPTETPRRRGRFLLTVVAIVVVLVAVGVLVVVLLNRGDGTSRTATPLEVRRLVAVFPCTPDRPGTPENLRLTAGQEVIKVPRAGCAVVGTVLAQVDRASKVAAKAGNPCTVTLDAPTQYGAAVDAASDVADGQARALVAGGWLLDVRAVISYPGRPSGPLHVVFNATDQAACDQVAAALKLS